MTPTQAAELQARSADHVLRVLHGKGRVAAAHRCIARLPSPLRQVALVVLRTLTASDIPASVGLPRGVVLMHRAIGVVISKDAKVEAPSVIFHGVTLGSSFVGKPGAPTIAPFVTIGAGASVLGDIVVGPFSSIGAGAVVTKSVPPMTIVLDSGGATRPQDPLVIQRRFGLSQPEADLYADHWRDARAAGQT